MALMCVAQLATDTKDVTAAAAATGVVVRVHHQPHGTAMHTDHVCAAPQTRPRVGRVAATSESCNGGRTTDAINHARTRASREHDLCCASCGGAAIAMYHTGQISICVVEDAGTIFRC